MKINRELHKKINLNAGDWFSVEFVHSIKYAVRGRKGGKGKKVPTNAPASIATSPSLPSFDIDTVRPAAVVVFPQTNTDLGATAAAALNN